MAIAQAEDRNWIVRRRRVGLYALLIAGTLLALLSARPDFRTSANSILFNSVGYSLSAMIFAGALTYVLALEHGIVYQVLTCKAARYLGRISYTFYLYHVAVLEKTAAYVSSPLARAFICFVLTFTVAAVSWYWLESRILNFSLESWKTRVLPALGEHGRATELRSELS